MGLDLMNWAAAELEVAAAAYVAAAAATPEGAAEPEAATENLSRWRRKKP
jgi:hypothetical protein